MKTSCALLVVALLGAPTLAFDDCCDGDPGWELSFNPPVADLGETMDVLLVGPQNDIAFLMASTGQGPIDSAYGTICLDFPLFFMALVRLDANGESHLPTTIPDDPALCGFIAYGQFLTCAEVRGLSNQARLVIRDQDCNECDRGKAASLTMVYTGLDCSATDTTQDPSFVECSGDPAMAALVHVVASDKSDPTKDNARVFFDADVALGDDIVIDAANDGETRLGGNTYVFITDSDGNLLHQVMFHTSCSQPLVIGDQFGSLLMTGFTAE